MGNADSVSTGAFGANFPTSTGAPGTGGHTDGGSDQLNPAGSGDTGAKGGSGNSAAATTDLSHQPAYNFAERVTNIVDQSSMPHDSILNELGKHQIPGVTNEGNTAENHGGGHLSHNHNGVN